MCKILLLTFLIAAAGCMSPKKAAKHYANTVGKNIKVDALIVPGLAFKSRNWPTLMKRRVIWSSVLYKQGICKHIIFSGGAVYTPFTEAYIMGLYAQKLGIPRSAILYDTIAEHSTENVYYSYLIAKENNFKSVALATDRFQSGFLKGFVRRRFGTPIHLIPVVKDTIDKYSFMEPKIDTNRAKVKHPEAFRSIKQRQPLTRRIRGTFGLNIPWNKYHKRRLPQL
jgi:uncharacterized SAM-binding protein YcdF (DUF218 family)